jgi:hypothetical protein
MGVGYGSFITHGFAFEEDPKLRLISSQFFGTGVIHAVEAEKHLKGLRIALHRSALEPLLKATETSSLNSYKLVPLPANQRSNAITHEWNYLGEVNHYHLEYTGQAPDRSSDQNLLMHIERMHANSNKTADIDKLYSSTKASFVQMTSLLGTWDQERTEKPT